MKTVLNIKTDKEVKERAQGLARHLGVPLSTVVNAYLKEFVASGEFSLKREPELTPKVQKELAAAVKSSKKDHSPEFESAEQAIEWLNS